MNARFGFWSAALGDVNGDGVPDFVTSADGQNVGANTNEGEVYIFSGRTGELLRTIDDPDPQTNADLFDGATGNLLGRLHDPTPQVGGQFGTSDAPAGDVDKDGFPDLIVGQTPHHNPAAANTVSKAPVFAGPGLTNVLMTFPDPQAQPNSDFGNSIASPGDVNGDGYPDYFIGARSADTDAGSNVGIVRAFISSPPATFPAVPVNVSPPTVSGSAVQGHILTEAHGSWSNSPTGYMYRWQRCNSVGCVAITGATAPSYTLTAADVGSSIRVQETASNAAGAGVPASSIPTALVRAAGPPVVTRYRVTNRRFAVGAARTPTFGTAAARKHARGTTFRYTLSEAATVKIAISRLLPGRRKGKSCVAPLKKPGKSKSAARASSSRGR